MAEIGIMWPNKRVMQRQSHGNESRLWRYHVNRHLASGRRRERTLRGVHERRTSWYVWIGIAVDFTATHLSSHFCVYLRRMHIMRFDICPFLGFFSLWLKVRSKRKIRARGTSIDRTTGRKSRILIASAKPPSSMAVMDSVLSRKGIEFCEL